MISKEKNEQRQDKFNSFRVSCNFGNAEMKNEFFELFYDPIDHTTIEITEDKTDEEASVHISLDNMEVTTAKEKREIDLPIDLMAEDESLFTYSSWEEDDNYPANSSRFSIGSDIINVDD